MPRVSMKMRNHCRLEALAGVASDMERSLSADREETVVRGARCGGGGV